MSFTEDMLHKINPTYRDWFIKIGNSIERDNITEFMNWLIYETDFCVAPASTRFHGAHEGGLLDHSLSVYNNMVTITNGQFSHSTVALVSLFHDICKVNFYTVSQRNVKDETTGKWTKAPYYSVDEELPYGSHGGKSVYLLMSHGIKLTDEEAIAINNHMGAWDYTTYHNPSNAYNKYSLAVYLHVADMLATYIDGK